MRDFTELRFEIRLNSPAFAGSVPAGKAPVKFFKKDQAGNWTPQEKQVDRFPVDRYGLRVPSLRGILEFWYRSLLGDQESGEIYRRQSAAFGSVTAGQGLSMVPLGGTGHSARELRFTGGMNDLQPFLYLGYGPLQLLKVARDPGRARWNERDPNEPDTIVSSYNENQARDTILVDGATPPVFKFIARGRKAQILALKRALTLFHLFGGIGSRSRRGWGSVEVVAEGIQSPPASERELAGWIRGTLGAVWSPRDYTGQGLPGFSALSPSTRIYVTAPQRGDYQAVLREFYRQFARVRSYRAKVPTAVGDHNIERSDAGKPAPQGITGVPLRLAFGMPYQPGHHRQWQISYRGRHPVAGGEEVSRRASPLLLKVVRLGPATYAGVALFLDASFFGDPSLEIGAVDKDLTRPFPGYAAIDELFAGSGWTQVPLPS